MIEEESKAMDLVNELLKDIPTQKLKSLKLYWNIIPNSTNNSLMPILECEFYEKERGN